jgi:hypothetical protein
MRCHKQISRVSSASMPDKSIGVEFLITKRLFQTSQHFDLAPSSHQRTTGISDEFDDLLDVTIGAISKKRANA